MTSYNFLLTGLLGLITVSVPVWAQDRVPPDDPRIAVAENEGGRYYTADGIPTFQIDDDGTVDWLTYSGFRRYHADCHVCHGPDGEGSSYAPALKGSALDMDYVSE